MGVVSVERLEEARRRREQNGVHEQQPPEWHSRVLLNDKGKLEQCTENAVVVLANDVRWSSVLAFDDFAQTIVTLRRAPWDVDSKPAGADAVPQMQPVEWSDNDTVRAQGWLARHYRIRIGREETRAAVALVADNRHIHPVRDWLDSLTWDSAERVDTWLSHYLGAVDTPYTRMVGSNFLVSAVARIYQPGCKVDTMIVLEGPQGTYKSTALRTLFGEKWFSDTPLDLDSKDRFVSLRQRWCIELAELDSLTRAGVERIKSFLSSPTDSYRPPYGRGLVTVARQCIFAGTTNATDYLRDESGNRRFWPVRCGRIDIDALAHDSEQLWAEARSIYDAGEQWWPTAGELEACKVEQAARMQVDEWQDRIASHLRKCPPIDYVRVADILADVLKLEPGKWGQTEQNRVARHLRALGWKRVQRRLDEAAGDNPDNRVWVYVRDTSVTGAEGEVVT